MKKISHEIHSYADSRLPFIFHDTVFQNGEGAANWHTNLELLCFGDGEGDLRIDERVYHVTAGDVGVINSCRIHHIFSGSVQRYCLIIDADFCTENGVNVALLSFEELFRDPEIFTLFAALAKEVKAKTEGASDGVLAIRSLVLQILLRLCRAHSQATFVTATPSPRHEAVRAAIRFLQEAKGPVTLEGVAASLHVSKYHLSHEFKHLTGMTVFEYLNSFRCESAKRLLQGGASVSEAAAASGFDNLSYFSRTFKRYVGVLPSRCKSQ